MRTSRSLLTLLALALALPAAASADDASENMSLVKNIPYPAKYDDHANYGTDVEFARIKGRQYAVAGSYKNGMQIVDITNPERARKVAVYDCAITQGDVQVFKGSRGRTLATYTSDTYGHTGSRCYQDAERLGFAVRKPSPSLTDKTNDGKNGTFIVDISTPSRPKTVSFVEVKQGSHNMTVHPGGKYLYNSNSDLYTGFASNGTPAIEIIDIRDPRRPKHAGELHFDPFPGLGTESHDITFNESGSRAYSAALSQGLIIDTRDPAKPRIVSRFEDPAINVWHQSDPVTIRDADGDTREFLIVEDEFAGAAGGPVCPSGGVHVYDVTGKKELAPTKVGYWNIEQAQVTNNPEGTCTAHVFRIHERARMMTMAFYNGGVRVIDLAGLATGDGIKEIGRYMTDNADSWSFKAPSITRGRDFYAYGNDIARGLDVYRFRARNTPSDEPGTWVPAAGGGPTLQVPDSARASTSRSATTRYICLLGGRY